MKNYEVALLLYWIVTTILTAYYFAIPPGRDNEGEDTTMLDFVVSLIPSIIVGWVVLPAYLLSKIVIKRNKSQANKKTTINRSIK